MLEKRHRGVVVLTTVIMLGAVISMIVLLLISTSASLATSRLYQSASQKLFFDLDSCAEEALARLDHDNNYSGGTLSLENSTCTITVTGSNSTRTVNVSASLQGHLNMVRNLQIGVTIYPTYTVTSWQELTT